MYCCFVLVLVLLRFSCAQESLARAVCSLRSVQSEGSGRDVLVVDVQRGACETALCRCSVTDNAGRVFELQTQYPYYEYTGGTRLLGFSPTHTRLNTVNVQFTDDFGASLLTEEREAFVSNLPFPNYFNAEPGSAVFENTSANSDLLQQTGEAAEADLVANIEETNEQVQQAVIAQEEAMQRRRRRRHLSGEQEKSAALRSLEEMDWEQYFAPFSQARWSRLLHHKEDSTERRALLQLDCSVSKNLFKCIEALCETFASDLRPVHRTSAILTNESRDMLGSGGALRSEEEIDSLLDLYEDEDFNNCMTQNYPFVSGYCLDLGENADGQSCQENQLERIELDLQMALSSVYNRQMLYLRNNLQITVEIQTSSIDFMAEFADQVDRLLNTSEIGRVNAERLRTLLDKLRTVEADVNTMVDTLRSSYKYMQESFTNDLDVQKEDLVSLNQSLYQQQINLGSTFEALSAFMEGTDSLLNNNFLYMTNLLQKGKAMTSIWKDLIALALSITEGGNAKPVLIAGLETLYSQELTNGWVPMLLEPPLAPVDWSQKSFVQDVYSWSVISSSRARRPTGAAGSLVWESYLEKITYTLVCDMVALSFGENKLGSFQQYLQLVGPPGCVAGTNCTCFVEHTVQQSINNPIRYRFAALQVLSAAEVILGNSSSLENFLKKPDRNCVQASNETICIPEYHSFEIGNRNDPSLGRLAVPFMLNDVEDQPWHWHVSAKNLTTAEAVLEAVATENHLTYIENQTYNLEPRNWFTNIFCSQRTAEERGQDLESLVTDGWIWFADASSNETKAFLEDLQARTTTACDSGSTFDTLGFGWSGFVAEGSGALDAASTAKLRHVWLSSTYEDAAERVFAVSPELAEIWGHPESGNLWGSLSDAERSGQGSASQSYLRAHRSTAYYFWTGFRERVIPLVLSIGLEVRQLGYGELPFPVYHAEKEVHFSTSNRNLATDEDPVQNLDAYEVVGGEEDSLLFRKEEIGLFRTESAGYLSASTDTTPVWRNMGGKLQLRTHLADVPNGTRVRHSFARNTHFRPPTDFLSAGYWKCWDSACPFRVTLQNRSTGDVLRVASFANSSTYVSRDGLEGDELVASVNSMPWFGGLASHGVPSTGRFPYVVDLSQEELQTALGRTFESRANSPFYLFMPAEEGSEETETWFKMGALHRNVTASLGDYLEASAGGFRPELGRRSLGLHISRLEEKRGVIYVDVGQGERVFSLRSFEKRCVTAKTVGGLCSLLEKFYASWNRTRGEVVSPGQRSSYGLRLYPKRWQQEVVLSVEGVATNETALVPPDLFSQTCPEFRLEQDLDVGWRVEVIPLLEFTQSFRLALVTADNNADCAGLSDVRLEMPEPFSSRSWFIPFCTGLEKVQVFSVNETTDREVLCSSLSAVPLDPPELALTLSNAKEMLKRERDRDADTFRLYGQTISQIEFSNDWEAIQSQLGTWVNEAPYLSSNETVSFLEPITSEIGDINAAIEETKKILKDDAARLEEAYNRDISGINNRNSDLDDLISLRDALLLLYDTSYIEARNLLVELQTEIDGLYSLYNTSEPLFFMFGDEAATYEEAEYAMQFLEKGFCLLDVQGDPQLLEGAFYVGCPWYTLSSTQCNQKMDLVWSAVVCGVLLALTLLILFFSTSLIIASVRVHKKKTI